MRGPSARPPPLGNAAGCEEVANLLRNEVMVFDGAVKIGQPDFARCRRGKQKVRSLHGLVSPEDASHGVDPLRPERVAWGIAIRQGYPNVLHPARQKAEDPLYARLAEVGVAHGVTEVLLPDQAMLMDAARAERGYGVGETVAEERKILRLLIGALSWERDG